MRKISHELRRGKTANEGQQNRSNEQHLKNPKLVGYTLRRNVKKFIKLLLLSKQSRAGSPARNDSNKLKRFRQKLQNMESITYFNRMGNVS